MITFRDFRTWAASSTVAHVSFAFFAMGSWAVFANRDHATQSMLLAGLVQGAISGSITFALKKFLDWIGARLSGLAALIAPPSLTAAAILLTLVTVHSLAGTPEIATTIALPFAVSTTYAVLYNWKNWRRT